jgi:glycosyltransferase involved in cell wall biosynthesis
MIMKNESRVIQRCLDSVKGLCSEVIIADTGSTDNSINIARNNGATVFSIPWTDDFSAARNASIARATADWILILDPDEILSRKDHDSIRTYVCDSRFHAYRLHTRNYTRDLRQQGALANPNDYAEGRDYPGFILSTKTRLFRRSAGLKFRGVWHELLDWDIELKKLAVATVKVPIHHYPHEISQASFREKSLFYNRLGLKKVKEWPYNPQSWHELFVSCMALGKYKKALYAAARALKLGAPTSGRFFSMARAFNEIGAKDFGTLAFEKGICLLYPNLTHIDLDKKSNKALEL